MLSKPLSALCAVALISAPHFSTAATFDVSNPTEFQTALTTAQGNFDDDTINVQGGTYNVATAGTLTYTAALTENYGLVIVGDFQAPTVLDGGGLVPILRIDTTAVIEDDGVYFEIYSLTFQNGNASTAPNDDGGALTILTDESLQPVERASMVLLDDLDFLSCAAADDGGAVYIRAHAVEGISLNNILFDRNQAGGDGGAAFVSGALLTTDQFYTDIDFFDNMAQGSGGGLFAEGFDVEAPSTAGRSAEFFDITFYNNQSMSGAGGGGGADLWIQDVSMNTVGFMDNQAFVGGGLRIRPNWSDIDMVNTGFTGNTAGGDGGGVAVLETPVFVGFTMTNNTIFDNDAGARGGGALVLADSSASILQIYNNIIYGNTAQQGSGADLYVDNRAFNDFGAGVEVSFNDITDFVVTPGPVTANSNIDEAPLFIDIAARPEADARLLAGSPGIDVGDNNAPGAPPRDFEGDARPFDGDGDMTATIDMGLDEFTGQVVQNADLAVTVSDDPDPVVEGDDVTLTIVVTNNGPGAASNVQLTGSLNEFAANVVSITPTQGTCSLLAGFLCDLGSIADSATATITLVATAPGPAGQEPITTSFSVSGAEPDPVTGNDSATELTTVVPPEAPTADLAVTMTDSPDPVLFDGSTVTYTMTVTNLGPDPATGVTLSNTVPPVGAAFQSAATDTGLCDAQPDNLGSLNCTIGDLAVDATATVTIVVAPTGVLGPTDSYQIINQATVSGNEVDPTAANNEASEDTTVLAAIADMRVAVTTPPGVVLIDDPITFTITVTNDGPLDNTNVVLTVTLPDMATLDSISIEQGSCKIVDETVTCVIGGMLNGDSVVATIQVTAPSDPMMLTLSALIAGDEPDSAVTSNNTATVNVNVINNVDLVIEGTSDGTGSFGWLEVFLLTTAAAAVAYARRLTASRASAAIAVACVAGLLVLTQPGTAVAEGDWYVSGNVGSLSLDYSEADLTSDLAARGWTITNVTVDDAGTPWKIVGGFNVNEYFAVEGGFVDLGDVTTRYSTSIPPTEITNILNDTLAVHPLQGDGWVTSAVLRWPVQDGFALTARAGWYFWESNVDVRVVTGGSGNVSDRESGSDAMYGIGLEWQLNDRWSVTADYERYQLVDWIDVPFVGVKYTF